MPLWMPLDRRVKPGDDKRGIADVGFAPANPTSRYSAARAKGGQTPQISSA